METFSNTTSICSFCSGVGEAFYSKMKITLLQTDIIWGQPEANLAHLDHLLEGVGECDLIVLPEMFTTGFDTNPETVADDEGMALKWMRNTVRQRNCALAGSVATKVGENYYNRMYFVSPDLLLASYDKHHLFTYGHEQEAFTPGHRRVVIPYRGVRILLQVCYDLRFPVFSRNRGDYDLAIYVANWPPCRSRNAKLISRQIVLLSCRAVLPSLAWLPSAEHRHGRHHSCHTKDCPHRRQE